MLVVHYYLDLSDDEAARMLDLPPGTYKSRLHRAMAAMRAELDADARRTERLSAGAIAMTTQRDLDRDLGAYFDRRRPSAGHPDGCWMPRWQGLSRPGSGRACWSPTGGGRGGWSAERASARGSPRW